MHGANETELIKNDTLQSNAGTAAAIGNSQKSRVQVLQRKKRGLRECVPFVTESDTEELMCLAPRLVTERHSS